MSLHPEDCMHAGSDLAHHLDETAQGTKNAKGKQLSSLTTSIPTERTSVAIPVTDSSSSSSFGMPFLNFSTFLRCISVEARPTPALHTWRVGRGGAQEDLLESREISAPLAFYPSVPRLALQAESSQRRNVQLRDLQLGAVWRFYKSRDEVAVSKGRIERV